jgi:integrase
MGWAKQLPDGRWRAFESEGSGGERLRANATGRTRTEARQRAAIKITQKRKEATLEPHTLTLAAYLKRWIEHLKTQRRSAKSLARYESICDALPPKLSKCTLKDLRPVHIQTWLDKCAAAEAPATTRKRYTVLHSALSRAVAWHLLLENPMQGVSAPVLHREEATALSEKQTAELLQKIKGTRAGTIATVAATTGLRRGELLALRWRDVDAKKGIITVARALDEGKDGVKAKAPKSGKPRKVPMMAATAAALEQHRKDQATERLKAKVWHDHGLVFPDVRGDLWRPSAFGMYWRRLETGVKFHELRHTYATLSLRAGVKVNVVSRILGHSSPVITMTIYAHVLDDADADAVERLESSLGKTLAAT